MTRHRVEAVIFDVDGTLLRSIEQHADAYRRTLEPLGVRVEPLTVFLLEGARSETIIHELLRAAGKDPSREEVLSLAHRKQAQYEALGTPRPYPGAIDCVREAHRRGFRLGLVTGTKRRNIDLLLPDIVGLFEVIRAQEDYTKDKPDPEPYLSAAEALAIHPRHCVVLENAPRGVESAKRAGMHVAAIPNTLPVERIRAHADWVVASYAEFLALLPAAAGGPVASGPASG